MCACVCVRACVRVCVCVCVCVFAAELLGKLQTQLSGKDFRERLEGLRQVESLAGGTLGNASEGQIVQLVDSLTVSICDTHTHTHTHTEREESVHVPMQL